MIEKFSLDHVGGAPGVFNPEKLEWVNFQHLKLMAPAALAEAIRPLVRARGWTPPGDDAWLARVVALLQERAKTLVDLADQLRCFVCDDVEIDPKAAAKHLAGADTAALRELRDRLATLSEWNAAAIERAFEEIRERHQIGLGKIAQPVRVALTGGTASPGIFDVVELVGRERAVARLDHALSSEARPAPANTPG
jgi:glutamyl-tRNA synthetase